MKQVSVILSTGTSPTMQQRDFRILCLLAVHCSWSASKPEITAAGWARKKQSSQNPGFCMVSRAKFPWNPTDSHSLSRQQLQTQLLSCEANTSLIHTAHRPRGSLKQMIQKHARSLHRQHKHSSGCATRHNFKIRTFLPSKESSQGNLDVRESWNGRWSWTALLLQYFPNLRVWTDVKQYSRRKRLPWHLQPDWDTPAHRHLTSDSLSVLWG